MNKSSVYKSVPLIAFLLLSLLLMRGLFLEPQTIPSVKINKSVPEFQLTNLINGKQLDQSILKGKWTLLNVWASWCEACSIEHPFLLQLNRQGVHLVGLNYKDSSDNAKAWLDNYGNPYQVVLYDKLGNVAIDFGVYGSPETFLIDSRGFIRYRHIGILSNSDWEQHFLPLINEKNHDKT